MKTNPFITHTSPKGRPYKVIGVGKIPNTDKWMNRTLKSHWYTIINFLDGNKERVKLKYDYFNKLYDKEKC